MRGAVAGESVVAPMSWQMMAAWLKAQWRDTSHEAYPYHRGLFEGRAECAEILAQCPPEWSAEQRLQRLYEHLNSTFPRTDSPEESDDE